MTPFHKREMVKKLKDVGSRIYRGMRTEQADGALVQDCADLIIGFLEAEDERAQRESFVRDGRRPLQALFLPDDLLVIHGAVTLKDPCNSSEAAVADAVAEIIGDWFEGQTASYLPSSGQEGACSTATA